MDIREKNSDYEMEIHFKKNVLRQLLLLEIVSLQRLKTNCLDVCV